MTTTRTMADRRGSKTRSVRGPAYSYGGEDDSSDSARFTYPEYRKDIPERVIRHRIRRNRSRRKHSARGRR